MRAALCMLSEDNHWYTETVRGTQDLTEHAKTIGFSRGTGEPLDNRGTGGPQFMSISSLMLSSSLEHLYGIKVLSILK